MFFEKNIWNVYYTELSPPIPADIVYGKIDANGDVEQVEARFTHDRIRRSAVQVQPLNGSLLWPLGIT